ncbi:MAG: hypothetical protein KBD01_15445 [Acidobacteria bacterium]|nr:hypothetical protein [Acidobacteriota bacterium]
MDVPPSFGRPGLARVDRDAAAGGRRARRLRERVRERFPRGALAVFSGRRVLERPDRSRGAVVAAELDRTLDALREAGTLLQFEEALAALLAGQLPPGLSFALSWDGGCEELWLHGVEVLAWHRLRSAVFVSGAAAAPGGRFWWDRDGACGRRAAPQLFQRRRELFVLGHGGVAHRSLEALAEEEQRQELGLLEVTTGPWLAYPFGGPGDAGERAAAAARAAGFSAAFTAQPGLALPGADPYRLPRIPLGQGRAAEVLRRLEALSAGAGS